jgi:glycosyltransferase involved in cell wall biosynthesis
LGTNLSTALKNKTAVSRWFRIAPMKKIYSDVDAIVAVSEGVRQDTLAITELPEARVFVARNPVINQEMIELADLPVDHAWLTGDASQEIPVVMAAGRLSHQKGFDVLIRAFAESVKERPARLIILGEGSLRLELENLAKELGVEESVDLPGFKSDIYSWLAKASLFVLSSRWEGSPNVLTEALALGVPSVSTRCPSGPDETLQEGKFGDLVEVDNWRELSEAMLRTLDNPKPKEVLQGAVSEFRDTVSAKHYLEILMSEKN